MTANLPISDCLTAADLREARYYLPNSNHQEQNDFANRQLKARQRVALLIDFYRRYPCRMANVHLLTSSSVAIGRFCGFSDSFNALGDAIMPVDSNGDPKNELWKKYVDSCIANLPEPVRDELWLEAHARDWREMQENQLFNRFFKEAEHHRDQQHWDLMRRHGEMTFGTRLNQLTEAGYLPAETTISLSIGLAIRRAITRGWPLMKYYLLQICRSINRTESERAGIASYDRISRTILGTAFRVRTIWKLYRHGLRIKNRGVHSPEVDWPLLETLLGDRIATIHPLIVRFYRNPGRFSAIATLNIRTIPLMFYSRIAAILLGQGLFEDNHDSIPTRLRVFRRDDGSMHFVRELYCGSILRVFDSDFVLRSINGKMLLVEMFRDISVNVVLDAEPRDNGGIAIVGRDIFWKGIRFPRTALKIDFTSRVMKDEDGTEKIDVLGTLSMEPKTRFGRFLMHTILRRPKELGSIRYLLTEN